MKYCQVPKSLDPSLHTLAAPKLQPKLLPVVQFSFPVIASDSPGPVILITAKSDDSFISKFESKANFFLELEPKPLNNNADSYTVRDTAKFLQPFLITFL
jgi:hypothetical protein